MQLCGDAHLANFGGFASPERNLLFDLNDFDETLPGPWEWDVKRFAASISVAARGRGIKRKQRRELVREAIARYRLAMRDFASQRTLDVWYARLSEREFERLRSRVAASAAKRYDKTVAKARVKTSRRAFAKLTERVDGEIRIKPDPPLIVPIEDFLPQADAADLEDAVGGLLEIYRDSLPHDRRMLFDRFRYVHIARKVVGVGSVGTRAWVILLLGRDDDDPLFLQAKEAQRSVLEPFAGPSEYDNQGQRVVEGQRRVQAASDIFLGWVRTTGIDGQERDFYVRQLWDWKVSADLETATREGLSTNAQVCAWTLARAHARTGDAEAIAAYLGSGEPFDKAMAEFAERVRRPERARPRRAARGDRRRPRRGGQRLTTGLDDDDGAGHLVVERAAAVGDHDRHVAPEQRKADHHAGDPHEGVPRSQRVTGGTDDADAHRPVAGRLAGRRPEPGEVRDPPEHERDAADCDRGRAHVVPLRQNREDEHHHRADREPREVDQRGVDRERDGAGDEACVRGVVVRLRLVAPMHAVCRRLRGAVEAPEAGVARHGHGSAGLDGGDRRRRRLAPQQAPRQALHLGVGGARAVADDARDLVGEPEALRPDRVGDGGAAGDLVHQQPQLLALQQAVDELVEQLAVDHALRDRRRLGAREHPLECLAGEDPVDDLDGQLRGQDRVDGGERRARGEVGRHPQGQAGKRTDIHHPRVAAGCALRITRSG